MREARLHYMGLAALFAAAFVACLVVFDYIVVLQYETPASFFVFSREFLARWLDHPGGLLIYADRFLRQFFHYEQLGALVISASITGIGILLYLVRKRLGGEIGIFHTFFPCLFLLSPHCASLFTVGILVNCGAFLGYLSFSESVPRQAYALLAAPVLYLVAGGYCWFFVVWVVGAAWLDRQFAFGVLYLAWAVCAPLAAYRWFFLVSLHSAWLYPFEIPHAFLDRTLCAYLLSMPLWPRLAWGVRLEAFCRSERGAAGQTVLLVALAVLLPALSYDPAAKQIADYHRLYKRRQWDGILARKARHPSPAGPDQFVEDYALAMSQFFTNYALYQKGKLLEEMFSYPQPWGTRGLVLNLPNLAEQMRRAMYNSDLYFEMGHVNAAYRAAYNQENLLGESFANVRRIAECNMANGNYELAEKYLNLLGKTLFHREFARFHKGLIADPAEADRQFAELRALAPTVEFDLDLGEFAILLSLVKSQPRHRMAFDYLTAWCLLDKASIPFIAGNLRGFEDAGYSSLPTHCQEALMVWESTGGTPVDLRGFAFDAGTVARFQGFGRQLRRYPSLSRAEGGLEPLLGGTYMYYYVFTMVPIEGTPPFSWARLGDELHSLGEVDEAILCYRQALLKHPESIEAERYGSRIDSLLRGAK